MASFSLLIFLKVFIVSSTCFMQSLDTHSAFFLIQGWTQAEAAEILLVQSGSNKPFNKFLASNET